MDKEQLNQILNMTLDDMLVDLRSSMLRYNLLKLQFDEKEAELPTASTSARVGSSAW